MKHVRRPSLFISNQDGVDFMTHDQWVDEWKFRFPFEHDVDNAKFSIQYRQDIRRFSGQIVCLYLDTDGNHWYLYNPNIGVSMYPFNYQWLQPVFPDFDELAKEEQLNIIKIALKLQQ